MVLRMPSPYRHPKTGGYYIIVRVPADLRNIEGKDRYKQSLKTKDPSQAKTRHATRYQELLQRWASLRGVPGPIPHKQLLALVGTYRQRLDAIVEDEPGEGSLWRAMTALETGCASTPEALELWAGSEADELLRGAGLSADDYSRRRLLEEMHNVRLEWATYQQRRANGDYRPDPAAQRFPEWKPSGEPEANLTISELFALWEREHLANGKPAKTAADFRHKIDKLRSFLKHDDAHRVTGPDVDRWCDHLRHDEGLAAKTVGEKYLAAVKAVFNLAVEKYRLPSNPVLKNRVRVPDVQLTRSRGFTDAEARAILQTALADPETLGRRSEFNKLAIRWVPWICAYTGARVGEAAQLRREDLLFEYGVPCLRITPESGTVKAGGYRVVPVHSHLIATGLLEFIQAKPSGPLFFSTGDDPLIRARSVGAKVGEWVRAVVGITDARVQPNHAWRHRFKTVCRDVGIDRDTRDAFQGHQDGTAASGYGEVTIKAMKLAMDTFPRVNLSEPD